MLAYTFVASGIAHGCSKVKLGKVNETLIKINPISKKLIRYILSSVPVLGEAFVPVYSSGR